MISIITTGLFICIIFLILCLVMLVRNEVIYRINIRAINEDEDIQLPDYDAMMWQITKWKYEHWIK